MATTPRGFRDILPDEAEMREHIVATVKARLVHHGYRPHPKRPLHRIR